RDAVSVVLPEIASMMALLSSGHVAVASSSTNIAARAARAFNAPSSTRIIRMPTAATTGIQRAAHRRLAASQASPTQASTPALRSVQRTLLNAVPRDILLLGPGPFDNAIAAR